MALDDLVETIETIKSRIEEHGASLSSNETRTRQVLIDPLLLALGWDVGDPNRVELEYSAGHGRSDYALLGDHGPVAVVEAKRLNDDIDNHVMQALNYANSQGIKYMVVTNGNDWHMYDVFKQAQISERAVVQLRIVRDAAHVSAIGALAMWRTRLNTHTETGIRSSASIEAGGALPTASHSESVVAEQGVRPSRVPSPRLDLTDAELPTQGGETQVANGEWRGNWHRVDLLGNLHGRRGPNAVRDLSGSLNRRHRSTWADFYRKTVSWLIDCGMLSVDNCPIKRPHSNRRIIASTTPYHGDGTPLKPNRFEYGGMFFDLDYTANHLVENTLFLFSMCNVDPSTVYVRFRYA